MGREKVRCPICGLRTKEVHLWTKNSFRYVRCTNCGLVCINPQLSDETIADISGNLLYEKKSQKLDLLLSTLDTYKSKLLKSFERFKKSNYLLDVGCFKGFLLYTASQRGWRVVGTEVSKSATHFAREHLQQRVDIGDLLDMSWLENLDFDVITLLDVIEHLSSPHRYLKKTDASPRAGGLLYLETANFNSLPKFLLGDKWTVFHSIHRYYFSPKTIKRMLRQAGFQQIRIRTMGFFPFSTRKDEPAVSKPKPPLKILRFLPMSQLRDAQQMVESILFYPLDTVGLRVGTKMVVWAIKGA